MLNIILHFYRHIREYFRIIYWYFVRVFSGTYTTSNSRTTVTLDMDYIFHISNFLGGKISFTAIISAWKLQLNHKPYSSITGRHMECHYIFIFLYKVWYIHTMNINLSLHAFCKNILTYINVCCSYLPLFGSASWNKSGWNGFSPRTTDHPLTGTVLHGSCLKSDLSLLKNGNKLVNGKELLVQVMKETQTIVICGA